MVFMVRDYDNASYRFVVRYVFQLFREFEFGSRINELASYKYGLYGHEEHATCNFAAIFCTFTWSVSTSSIPSTRILDVKT